jgi:hypothetical protein
MFVKFTHHHDGSGGPTHVREYAWAELAKLLQMAGFDTEVQCFNAYEVRCVVGGKARRWGGGGSACSSRALGGKGCAA